VSQRQKLRMGLIGGGGNGFIGRVHVTAATLDREADLVAGAFSSDPEKSRASASIFDVNEERAYGCYQELFAKERLLPRSDRIDFVSIATPNHTHADIATQALRSGFHVICDKPMTTELSEAASLVQLVAESKKVFVLSHNYSGYPMVRQAREMIEDGEIGDILAVRVSYQQGWMHGMKPDSIPERGAWKSDPIKNGRAGSLGDVGTHAFHLLRFVTQLRPETLMCTMKSFSNHHQLDDYGHALIQLENQAIGSVTWSQVSHGKLNDLTLQVDGTKGALSWKQEKPNQLIVGRLGRPTMTYDRHPRADYLKSSAQLACRLPAGHPEAFFEAFANVYRDAYVKMRVSEQSEAEAEGSRGSLCPTVSDGFEGVLFTHLCLDSQANRSTWIPWSC